MKQNGNNDGNALPNSSVRSGEAQEGASKSGVGYEQGLEEKAYGGAENGLRTQNVQNGQVGVQDGQTTPNQDVNYWEQRIGRYSRRTALALIMIVAMLLVLGTVAIVAVIVGTEMQKNTLDQESEADSVEKVEELKPVESEESSVTGDSSIVELSLDNQLVQRLYHNFDGVENGRVGGSGPVREARFYVDKDAWTGNPSMQLMAGVALQVVPRGYSCKGWWDNNPDYYFDSKMDYSSRKSPEGCYDGESVRRKAREMFGKDLVLQDGDIATSDYCGSYRYNAQYDEFYDQAMGCGGSGGEFVDRYLYRAERDAQNIYLYEAVIVEMIGASYQILPPNEAHEIVDKDRAVYERECIHSNCGDELFVISEHLDELDKFKWTFTKNADGEYVFAGLERVQ